MKLPVALADILDHQPVALRFGTSGRRGLLKDLSQLEVYLNALAEIEFLKTLPPGEGGIVAGDDFYIAADLRPSSTRILESGRGGLLQAIFRAVADSGLCPVYLGTIPTPALTAHAIAKGKGSIMVTGSHIPFDRNGFKTNTAIGELLKHHEAPIADYVERVRARLYAEGSEHSAFTSSGMLKEGGSELPEVESDAAEAYVARYLEFFGEGALAGLELLVYQHSAVGRDLLPLILEKLGARVECVGRSDVFVPIDTENVDQRCLETIQELLDTARIGKRGFDAVVSTDGDSDRPLVLAVNPKTGNVDFCGGDLLGMITAEFLQPDAVVVPVSCNDGIDRGSLKDVVEAKTRIGSPFVIRGMLDAIARGRRRVVGWEANGGFLLGSPIEKEGRYLSALPTRDAMLPIIATLAYARSQRLGLHEVLQKLPPRYGRAALLKDFSREKSDKILSTLRVDQRDVSQKSPVFQAWAECITRYFPPSLGFGVPVGVDCTDGLRIYFEGGDVAHLRPSGNADEFRIYAVSDSKSRAAEIVALGVKEPDGILRTLERSLV